MNGLVSDEKKDEIINELRLEINELEFTNARSSTESSNSNDSQISCDFFDQFKNKKPTISKKIYENEIDSYLNLILSQEEKKS